MHLDYRGGSDHHLHRPDHEAWQPPPLLQKEASLPLFSCHVAFRLFHLQFLCVHATVLLSALEWHGILIACWSVVNSNVNGLAGNPLSARLGGEKGREEGIWGLRGREAEV